LHLRNVHWFLIAGLLALAPTVRGDSVITVTGINGAVANNVYVGAYYGTINGNPALLYCDDYVHHAYLGQSHSAQVGTFADLSHALYGSVDDALNKYRQVAWLIDQFGATSSSQWGDIHFALWSIFNPSVVPLSSGAQSWLAQAVAGGTGNTSLDGKYVIYTPTTPGASQEFLALAPTPEPESIVLLATALAGAFLIAVRRRRVQS
jgi:hypothetical protein